MVSQQGAETLILVFSALVVALQIAPLALALPLYTLSWGKTKPRRVPRPAGPGELEFVVVSKASLSVLPSLLEVIRRVRATFPEYRLWVVVDEDSIGVPELEEASRRLGFRLVRVPEWYDKGKYKARAIQYFIDNYVYPDKWYVFLDDDSYPLDREFLYQLDPDTPVYNGRIYPRRGGSLLAWVADSSRYFHAITRARAALAGLGKPLYGLNGELLIVRGWVLLRVGVATDSIVEDSHFAAKLMARGIRVGQVTTRVSILSPNTIIDLWRQRARWNLGVLADIVRMRYPPLLALYRGADALAWLALPLAPAAWIILSHYTLTIGGLAPTVLGILGLLVITASTASTILVPYLEDGLRGAIRGILLMPMLMLAYMLGTIYAVLKADEILSTFVLIDKGGGRVTSTGSRNRPTSDPRLNPPSPGPNSQAPVLAARAYIN